MFSVAFFTLVLIAVLSICIHLFMRIRLTQRELSSDKLVWWRRSSDDVAARYAELFPGTHLPLFGQFAFWVIAAAAAALLVTILLKSR